MDNENKHEECTRSIANFFRRFAAFFIDGIILGIAGLFAGLALGDHFVALGWKGRFIGVAVSLLYFSVFNSEVLNGQTIGKKILSLQVVQRNGRLLPYHKSLIRSLVLLLFGFLNGWSIPGLTDSVVVSSIYGFILFGVGLLLVYLYVFNVKTRQSIHDLIFDTFVIRTGINNPCPFGVISRKHYMVSGALLLGIIVVGLLSANLSKNEPFKNLIVIRDAIENLEPVYNVTVKRSSFRGFKKQDSPTELIAVVAYTNDKANLRSDVHAAIANMILHHANDLSDSDLIVIQMVYGYDIGISRNWERNPVQHTVAEWRNLLSESK